ncbi:hypothetical protein Poli38472_006458 [Pythium oligandrum]|uniref:Uncharacterized protein n=1 Tax=Pythium oligandrum TaxID=41045 RepID=A0A8K1C4V1_PYTOL|nr:hypothetical protein Poli38472_006458 [Pythium oligandrum]|eukprot:TMW56448.1 hypothetical protein Poli38472_006458 [Pythium oligandrum]
MLNPSIGQPVGKVLMTNVAVVRLKRGGKRFEIACYKNKVQNWRNGVEEDIGEVLQIAKVYENVSKGKFAKFQEWSKAFNTKDEEQACRVILDQGELQVSEGERKAHNENMLKDIATIVAQKCVNPNSNRPYPFSVIERLMKEIHYAVVPNRSAKQQALEVIKRLQEHIPIERAKMKIQVTAPIDAAKSIKEALDKQHDAQIVEASWNDPARMVLLIAPGSYRILDSLVQEHAKGAGSLEVLDLNYHQEGEHSINDEITQKVERLGLTTEPAATSKPAPAPQVVVQVASAADQPAKKGKQCSTCGGDFGDDPQRYREHFRSEWHRYNLKLKAKKMPVIDEATFDAIDEDDVKKFFATLNE